MLRFSNTSQLISSTSLLKRVVLQQQPQLQQPQQPTGTRSYVKKMVTRRMYNSIRTETVNWDNIRRSETLEALCLPPAIKDENKLKMEAQNVDSTEAENASSAQNATSDLLDMIHKIKYEESREEVDLSPNVTPRAVTARSLVRAFWDPDYITRQQDQYTKKTKKSRFYYQAGENSVMFEFARLKLEEINKMELKELERQKNVVEYAKLLKEKTKEEISSSMAKV
ncbi:hypothetical protein SAMD00019534_047120 [Acytostelium subglobosum LB1]|uniref:hypothetical protein n=1 Tax=Acytostelium subglobosum LB1 TaxID=1410327 RepID=UPI000644D949|nr:hypothetical protein SAMD00019534_047120 [Acytostelium subglobosum LB1]GAM21537.1 hypothetical protein SAMD00019534_047120 [Acytostelium subglobosum LB1]|eukprot:XP_012755656.1 hypothetical protein SAMD00019534_047120 [Acytostelium subglobosum LB1]